MKEIKTIEKITFPMFELTENFEFDAICQSGTFTLNFKWLNDRWNLWVTFPDKSVRQASVCPDVVSWSGYNDYGFYFKYSNSDKIDYSSLLLSEVYLITWV